MMLPAFVVASNTFAVDSLNVFRDAVDKNAYIAGKYGRNALDYLMSRRFRKADAIQYSNKGLLSHLYVGGLFSYDFYAPRGNYDYLGGNAWGLLIGKEINKLHSAELLFMYGTNEMKKEGALLDRYSLQLTHHFNTSRYLFGYNPYRLFELSTAIGAGVQFSTMWDKDYTSPYLHLGLLGTFNLGRRVNLVVEPHLAIGGEGYNGSPKENWYSD
ncbi:MAG: hypothetical protein IKL29_08960, partial [Bacteroidaceae bacterium]|nr:hypothetical protein [Bacteroidaceae bacterium]